LVIVWRKRDRRIRCWLRDDREFARADLHRARLVAMNLRSKSFPDANLEFADLTEADLEGADLRGANLNGAYLTGAELVGADLRGATLRDAYLLATNLDRARLEEADLSGIIYDQATTWPVGYQPPRPDVGLWHGRRDQ
jgi:uncharacterized protein YjbI with pentapeptide repeats